MASTFSQVGSQGWITTSNGSSTFLVGSEIPEDSTATLFVKVTGRKISDGTSKTWAYEIACKRIGSGDVSIIGSMSLLSSLGDLGAALWGVSSDISGNQVQIFVSGAAATSIVWAGDMNGIAVYNA